MTANASLVDLKYVGYGPYDTVNVNVYNTADNSLKETVNNVVAGFYQIRIDSGPVLSTFCIDIADSSGNDPNAQIVPLAAAPDTWAGPMGSTAAGIVKQLWANYYSGAVGNASEAAALQVAIWMAIDNAKTEYYAVFSGNSTVTTRAAAMLTAPNANGKGAADLLAVTSSLYQDFIVPVPEPTTMIAGALLLLPFGVSTLRMLRRR